MSVLSDSGTLLSEFAEFLLVIAVVVPADSGRWGHAFDGHKNSMS
jgi:hypothetical protein